MSWTLFFFPADNFCRGHSFWQIERIPWEYRGQRCAAADRRHIISFERFTFGSNLSAVGGIFDYWPQRLLPKWRRVTNRKDSRELTRSSSPLLTSLVNVIPHIRREDRWTLSRLSHFRHRHYRRQHAYRPEQYFRLVHSQRGKKKVSGRGI